MQVLAVCLLYMRCVGCDPADRGVHPSKRTVKAKLRAALKAEDLTQANIDTFLQNQHDEPERNSASTKKSPKIEAASGASVWARWLCFPFACCRKDDSSKLNSGEQLLYCSICEAEVWLCFVF